MKNIRFIFIFLVVFLTLEGCGIYPVPPSGVDHHSYIGEKTPSQKDFEKLPIPKNKIEVGVYNFRDQTGQYKASNNNANWSTAIPQGLTSILTKALEDSKWFVPIERENLGNLLNERQIIEKTRQQYNNNENEVQLLPPLLFAGTLLEGGVISYDTNILTGGAGVRYFGVGGSSEYRQDRITVYLRAISTSNGKVLKTIYTSKTILSQSINSSLFKYVDPERLLEVEIGITNNEPTQMAVSEAINKAVYLLILEGIQDGLWEPTNSGSENIGHLLEDYEQEVYKSNERVAGKGNWNQKRSSFSLSAAYTLNNLKSDYGSAPVKPGAKVQVGYRFFDYLSLNAAAGIQTLGKKQFFQSKFLTTELGLEYMILPFNSFTPYVIGDIGIISDIKNSNNRSLKFYSGFSGGLEYMFSKSVGIRGQITYNMGFDDDWDQMVSGKRNDHFLQIGLGLQLDLGNLFNNTSSK